MKDRTAAKINTAPAQGKSQSVPLRAAEMGSLRISATYTLAWWRRESVSARSDVYVELIEYKSPSTSKVSVETGRP